MGRGQEGICNQFSASYLSKFWEYGDCGLIGAGWGSSGKWCSRILVCLLLSSCTHISCVDTNVYIEIELWHEASLLGIWASFPVKFWAVVFKWIDTYIEKETACMKFYFKTVRNLLAPASRNRKSKSYMHYYFSVTLRSIRIRYWIFLTLKPWLPGHHVHVEMSGCIHATKLEF